MHLELERYRLDKLPEIVAQMMKPAEKIDSIRIHQVSGLGAAPGVAGSESASRPPVNQVLDSILGMALQLPALKSIGESIGYDFSAALPKGSGAGRGRQEDGGIGAGPSAGWHPVPLGGLHPNQEETKGMSISRRDFLAATGAAAVAGGLRPLGGVRAGQRNQARQSVLDNSGNLDIYGKPMVMATTMAVEELNASGGLLGRQIKAIQYDTQSDIALYTKFAQQLARTDKVDVVHGGITSASREAIRQTFRRSDTLYFYNVLYEGGVCDRNIVITGTTPAQAVEPIVDYATKKWGKKVYILAADYNYGQITAKWLQHYIAQRGGSVASTDFFPLDVADFGSTIAKIQQANPNWVVSALVGGAHMAYYRQWAAQGMNKKIPLTSTTFGVGNEHLALSPGRRRRHHHRRQLQPGGEHARPTRSSWRGGRNASATRRSCMRSRYRSTRESTCGPRA